jgi:glutathione synthase
MALNVAVQADPIESFDITGDSTFALMLEAQRSGHQGQRLQRRAL